MARKTVEQRFWEKVDKSGPNGCWNWTASTVFFGYGEIGIGGKKKKRAHRLSWELHNGKIPADRWVLHKCNNPACVNPDHLYLGTPKDNMQDKKRAGRQNLWGRKVPGVQGEKNHNAQLTEAKVRQLREEYKKEGVTFSDLERKYGFNHETIRRAVIGQTWKYIE